MFQLYCSLSLSLKDHNARNVMMCECYCWRNNKIESGSESESDTNRSKSESKRVTIITCQARNSSTISISCWTTRFILLQTDKGKAEIVQCNTQKYTMCVKMVHFITKRQISSCQKLLPIVTITLSASLSLTLPESGSLTYSISNL